MALFMLLIAAIEIPLDQVWGFDLPGTRDVAGLTLPVVDEKKQPGIDHESYRMQRAAFIEQIRQQLTTKPGSMDALPGFVLSRTPDFYTLRTVSSRLAITKKMGMPGYKPSPFGLMQASPLPPSEEITLVIFSHPCSYFFRLKQVERDANTFTVRYQFEPHYSPESTVHFALIPLGKLPIGDYRVKMEQLPMEKQWQEAGFLRVHDARARNLVSLPFSFSVAEKPPQPQKPNLRLLKGAVPLLSDAEAGPTCFAAIKATFQATRP
jgi:hypothetical protein